MTRGGLWPGSALATTGQCDAPVGDGCVLEVGADGGLLDDADVDVDVVDDVLVDDVEDEDGVEVDVEGHGVLGEPGDGDGHGVPDVLGEDEVDGGSVVGFVGGGTLWSFPPEPPVGRANQVPVSGSKSTMTVRLTTVGAMTTTFVGLNDVQVGPVKVSDVLAAGGRSGLPQEHRTRGTPRLSTSTAVPAWRTDWKLVAAPLRKPWLVTRVSTRSTTGVSAWR